MKRVPRAFVRKKARFARSVRGVLNQELQRRTVLYDFTLNWCVAKKSLNAAHRNRVGWMEIPFRHLNNIGATQSYGAQYIDFDNYVAVTNPCGFGPLLKTGDYDAVTVSGAPTIKDSATAAGVVSLDATGKIHRFQELGCRMHINLRNTRTHGYWLDVFYCKARRPGVIGGLCNTGVKDVPVEFQGYSDMQTPLECMSVGVAQTANTTPSIDLLRSSTHVGLSDSLQFRRYWRVTKKCRVYLPPGGTFEKALVSKRVRALKSDYIAQYAFDRSTEYLVVRAVPEVGVGPNTGITQKTVPVLPAVDSSATTDNTDIVGLVSYRFNYKQINTETSYDLVRQVYYAPNMQLGLIDTTAQVTNVVAK